MSHSNDKNESSGNSEILKELAIFDYVAGNLSDSAKQNFERMLEQSPALQDEVKAETLLRQRMEKIGETEPVAMSNIEALFEKIDEHEKAEKVTQSIEATSDKDSSEETANNKVTPLFKETPSFKEKKSGFSKYYATAAGLAMFTIVFSGIYFDSAAPDFQTLSDIPASQKIDFKLLASESRIAKLTLVEGVSDDQVTELLDTFKLTSISAGSPSNQRFVSAEAALSNEILERLRNDNRLRNVELYKINNGE